MNTYINPTGLKGQEEMDKLMNLMETINHIDTDTSKVTSVGTSKKGPDGNVYAVIKEESKYFIKVAPFGDDLKESDFKYIGGLQNKLSEAYSSYAQATKRLSGKLRNLYEAYNVKGNIDVLTSEHLVQEEKETKHEPLEGLPKVKEVNDSEKAGTPGYEEFEVGSTKEDRPTSEGIKESKGISLANALMGDGDATPTGYNDLIFKKKS